MTRRGSADLPSGPGKLDVKPAGRLPRAAACRSAGRAALIASVAAGEVRAVACLSTAVADPPWWQRNRHPARSVARAAGHGPA